MKPLWKRLRDIADDLKDIPVNYDGSVDFAIDAIREASERLRPRKPEE